MKIIKILPVLLALVAAQAQGANLYLGAGLGAGMPMNVDSNVHDGRGILSNLGPTTQITYDTVAPSPAVLVGFDVTPNLAGEVQYVYLGNYQLHTSVAGGVAKESEDVHAWSFAAVGKFWLGPKVHLLGKLGFADSVVDMTCSIPGQRCDSATDSAVGFLFGAGLALVPARELELRLDYSQYSGIGNKHRDFTAGPFGVVEGLVIYHF